MNYDSKVCDKLKEIDIINHIDDWASGNWDAVINELTSTKRSGGDPAKAIDAMFKAAKSKFNSMIDQGYMKYAKMADTLNDRPYARSATLKRSSDSINDSFTFKLSKKKNDYDEYTVACYKDGRYYEDGSYTTEDWDDAVKTIKALAKQQNLNVTQKGSSYIADSAKVKDGKYIYLFPYDEVTSEDRAEMKRIGLKILGRNKENGEDNLAVSGSLSQLHKYCDDWIGFGYDMHPDYLYREEDFAGSLRKDSTESIVRAVKQFKNYSGK